MKRRQAISRILLISGGAIAGYSAYKWWDWNKSPDLKYLDANKTLIASLADALIPKTKTPGALDAQVEDYIILMVKDCTEIKSQNKFIDGLKELQSFCHSNFGHHFGNCNQDEKNKTLTHFELRGKSYGGVMGKVENKFFGRSFFATLKTLTSEGYCSSEIGANQGLAYSFIPGKFVGCMPLQPGQKSWATH